MLSFISGNVLLLKRRKRIQSGKEREYRKEYMDDALEI